MIIVLLTHGCDAIRIILLIFNKTMSVVIKKIEIKRKKINDFSKNNIKYRSFKLSHFDAPYFVYKIEKGCSIKPV